MTPDWPQLGPGDENLRRALEELDRSLPSAAERRQLLEAGLVRALVDVAMERLRRASPGALMPLGLWGHDSGDATLTH